MIKIIRNGNLSKKKYDKIIHKYLLDVCRSSAVAMALKYRHIACLSPGESEPFTQPKHPRNHHLTRKRTREITSPSHQQENFILSERKPAKYSILRKSGETSSPAGAGRA